MAERLRGAAERLEAWLKGATGPGAEAITGGQRDGLLWQPTVLASLTEDISLSCKKAFGPFVGPYQYTDPLAAIKAVDTGDFGLRAGRACATPSRK